MQQQKINCNHFRGGGREEVHRYLIWSFRFSWFESNAIVAFDISKLKNDFSSSSYILTDTISKRNHNRLKKKVVPYYHLLRERKMAISSRSIYAIWLKKIWIDNNLWFFLKKSFSINHIRFRKFRKRKDFLISILCPPVNVYSDNYSEVLHNLPLCLGQWKIISHSAEDCPTKSSTYNKRAFVSLSLMTS